MDLTVLRVVVGVVIVILLMPVVINSAPKQSWGQSTRFSSFLCWFCLCDVESSLDVSTVHSSWVKQSWSESPPGLVVNITWLILGARPAAGQLRKSAGQGWGLGWNSVMSATCLLKFTKLYGPFPDLITMLTVAHKHYEDKKKNCLYSKILYNNVGPVF